VPPPFERSQIIHAAGVDAHVAEAGAGPEILFVHGNPDSHDVWSEVTRRLAPRARCIAPDLPNWGASVGPRRFDCSLEHQAAYIAGVIDGLGLAAVHLVVHDIGGAFGLAFAALHPERIRTLTIFNTSFFPDYVWHRLGRLWRTPVLGELVMLLAARRWFVGGIHDSAPALPLAYVNHAYDGFRWRTRRMVLRYYRAMDYARVLPGWDRRLLDATRSIPKQVLWGDRDPYIPLATADRFEAPVHHFPNHSHWVMQESPDEAARLIGALVHAK
jgi:pimeloyl-ACP methyl ester carboxylesterase